MNQEIKNKIEQLKKEIDTYRPLSKDVEGRIMQKFRLDWNFHSNNIEGNQLTFGETRALIFNGLDSSLAKGKTLRDHLDVINHNEALLALETIVEENIPISENLIRQLHEVILDASKENLAVSSLGRKRSKKINVGEYKKLPNYVETKSGEKFYFASPEETPSKMYDLINWYRKSIGENKLSIVEIAAEFHSTFVIIHPFEDGNGRLARILMNLIFMKNNYPPVIIKTQDKNNYISALQAVTQKDASPFVDYVADNLIESLNLFLRGSKGEDISELSDLHKEFALLRKELEENKKGEVLKRSKDLIIQRYEDTFSEVFNQLKTELIKFEDLFTNKKIRYSINGTSANNIENYIEYTFEKYINRNIDFKGVPKELFNQDWKRIGFDYEFEGFRSNGIHVFNMYVNIDIYFHDYKYLIKFDSKEKMIIEKLYSDQLSKGEIKDILYAVIQSAIHYIKDNTSS